MLDHVSLAVSDYARARAFYDAALTPLGYRAVMEFGQFAGYGRDRPQFWVGFTGETPVVNGTGFHMAFMAADRAAVDAFHRAAIAAGGRDNGPPGLRPEYHPDYYAAFVIDQDGHRIEAVCHKPA